MDSVIMSRSGSLLALILATTLCACGSDAPPTEPVVPPPPVTYASIWAGDGHACAIDTRGFAYCWGRNTFGQVGDGTTTDRLRPTLVSDELTFVSIGAGYAHTCGLTADAAIVCWGGNRAGQFGDGTMSDHPDPRAVPGDRRYISLAVGSYHVCAVTVDHETYCWGAAGLSRDDGTLGGPASEICGGYYGAGGQWPCSTTPVRVAGDHRFDSLTAGVAYTCGLTAAGDAYCWGFNAFQVYGDGTDTESAVPVPAAGAVRFQRLDGGGTHACGIQDGVGYCWGARSGSYGQLGNGTFYGSSTPSRVAGGITFRLLRPYRGNNTDAHTCGIAADDVAYCWGNNRMGQLGTTAPDLCNGSSSNPPPCASVPLPVDGGLAFRDVSAGVQFTCGVTTAGVVYCWGSNEYGQLGNGTMTSATAPVAVVVPD